MTEILIEVNKGMVIAVHSTDPQLKVNLCDHDCLNERVEQENKELLKAARSKNMHQVFLI